MAISRRYHREYGSPADEWAERTAGGDRAGRGVQPGARALPGGRPAQLLPEHRTLRSVQPALHPGRRDLRAGAGGDAAGGALAPALAGPPARAERPAVR